MKPRICMPTARGFKKKAFYCAQYEAQDVLSDVADAYELLGNRRLARLYLQQAIANGLPVADLKTDPYARNVIADPQFRPPKG